MNAEDTNVTLEDLNQTQNTNKTNSRLRNMGGYLLNKFTKTKSKSSVMNVSQSVNNQKKRKNFFSLFEREPKNQLSLQQHQQQQELLNLTDKSTVEFKSTQNDLIDGFDKFVSKHETNVNNESSIGQKSLDNSMAKSKIQAASKRRTTPRTHQQQQSISDFKLESINEFQVSEIKSDYQTNKFKSNESLDDLISKTMRNLNRKSAVSTKAPASTPVSSYDLTNTKIIDSFVKISNELNLDQEKTLASETIGYIQKSTSCNSGTSSNEVNLHIYDNSTPLNHYNDSSISDDVSLDENNPSTITNTDNNNNNNNLKKVKLASYNSHDSHFNQTNKTNRIDELKSKFNNLTCNNSNTNSSNEKSSKSVEALDKIQRQITLNSDHNKIEKISQENDQLNKKFLTYSKSLKLNTTTSNDTNESTKPCGRRVATIISGLNNSNDSVRTSRQQSNWCQDSQLASNDKETKLPEKGKVKLIVKGLEK